MLVAGGAANSMIIFHAESVKVPVNCTLTSASELEAALPKELLPISALGKRIHHCRPRETAKSFPELPAAKSPCSPRLSFFSFSFFLPRKGKRGRVLDCFCSLWVWQKQDGGRSEGQHGVSLGLCPPTGLAALWPLVLAPRRLHQLGTGDLPKVPAGRSGVSCTPAVGALQPLVSSWG